MVKLLIMQKRAIRLICSVGSGCHCKSIFKKLSVSTVPSSFILECFNIMLNLIQVIFVQTL